MLGVVLPVYREDVLQQTGTEIVDAFLWSPGIAYHICVVEHYDTGFAHQQVSRKQKIEPDTSWDSPDYNIHYIRLPRKTKIQERMVGSFIGYQWLMENTDCEAITDIDADLSQNLKQLNFGHLKVKEGVDCAIMSRHKESSASDRSKSRTRISKFITFTCNLLTKFKYPITDWSHTYRFYSRDAMQKILNVGLIVEPGVMPMVILLNLLQNGCSVEEYTTSYKEVPGSHVKMKRYARHYLWNLLKGIMIYYRAENYTKLAIRAQTS